MCCPPSRNGNMPAVRARPRPTHGGRQLPVRMRIITGTAVLMTETILNKLAMWGNIAANPWGFFDMHGNVWEWTADWYQAAYPTGNPVVDPTGPASGSLRVLRGGSWYNGGTALRSAKRYSTPGHRTHLASVLVSNSSSKGREEASSMGVLFP